MRFSISMLKNIILLHTKCQHMTLAFSTPINNFLLHTKMQDYHLDSKVSRFAILIVIM